MREYHINLEKYSIQKFKKSIKNRDMIPSRMILKQNLEERFKTFKANGIKNLQDLIEELKSKQKIEEFSKRYNLPIDYLTILNREARSYHPKPTPLNKFAEINTKDIKKLEEIGIKNTKQLYNNSRSEKEIKSLITKSGIQKERLNELVALSDLSRLYGVGPVFARMIYDVGVKSVKNFIELSPEKFIEIYENKTNKKADFGVNDIKFSIELGRELES